MEYYRLFSCLKISLDLILSSHLRLGAPNYSVYLAYLTKKFYLHLISHAFFSSSLIWASH
jgi:hypothetical protein